MNLRCRHIIFGVWWLVVTHCHPTIEKKYRKTSSFIYGSIQNLTVEEYVEFPPSTSWPQIIAHTIIQWECSQPLFKFIMLRYKKLSRMMTIVSFTKTKNQKSLRKCKKRINLETDIHSQSSYWNIPKFQFIRFIIKKLIFELCLFYIFSVWLIQFLLVKSFLVISNLENVSKNRDNNQSKIISS